MELFLLIFAGVLSGICSGLFGIGGGVVLVPFLVYFLHCNQQTAVGTSLAALLAPIGILAVLTYHQQGFVDWKKGMILGVTMIFTSFLGAKIGVTLGSDALKFSFGVFLCCLGVYTLLTTYHKL